MVDVNGYFKSFLDTLPLLLIVVWLYWTRMVGAPWVPSSLEIANRMLTLANVGPDDVVYDLGCGDGRLVLVAAIKYHARAVGVEIDPLRYLWCQLMVILTGQRKRVRIVLGNIFNKDLSDATVVMCYLLPEALKKLEDKFRQELPPGARIISNKYPFPTLTKVSEDGNAILYKV